MAAATTDCQLGCIERYGHHAKWCRESVPGAAMATGRACACFLDCGEDSHSGDWHQHDGDPCRIHPGTRRLKVQ